MAVVTLVLLTGLIASLLMLWSRSYVRRQSELAREDADRERALLVHDASNAMMSMQLLVELAELEPDEARDATRAVETLTDMLRLMRPGAATLGEISIAEAVKSARAIYKRHAPIEVELSGSGPSWPLKDARTLVNNLVSNATREAGKHGGVVKVVLNKDHLRVSNAIGADVVLGDEIYDEGVSGNGSTEP